MIFYYDMMVILKVDFGSKNYEYNIKNATIYRKRFFNVKNKFYTNISLSYHILYNSENIELNLKRYCDLFNLNLISNLL